MELQVFITTRDERPCGLDYDDEVHRADAKKRSVMGRAGIRSDVTFRKPGTNERVSSGIG